MTRRLTIIESPFAASNWEHEQHLYYLRLCLRDSWERGELPFASHAFFPFFLKESDPEERKLGIEAGYEFWDFTYHENNEPEHYELGVEVYPLIAFYTDLGMSPGMKQALDRATKLGREIDLRTLKTFNKE
jgi:hypothetical protein